MISSMPRFGLLFFALLSASLAGSCVQPAQDWQLNGQTMGTSYQINVSNCPHDTCTQALNEQIEVLLQNLNKQTSHFDPESELSLFNLQDTTEWFPVSADLATIVSLALEISELSDGAFDITAAAAVDVWGFGAAQSTSSAPLDASVDLAQRHSGWRKLAVNESGSALRKSDPLVRIDLSAIAKGYAVDQLAYQLELNGLNNYLVEIGGEIRIAGLRADGKPWRIGIQPPGDDLDISFIVSPGDNAVATSGDYINYRLVDGIRIAHTIDSRTARPANSGLTSVSVIRPSASEADALATALMVMGPEKAQAFATQLKLPVLLLVSDGAAIQPTVTPEFEAYLVVD